MRTSGILIFCFLLCAFSMISQSVSVEGYAYEEGNRGFLNQVRVNFYEKGSDRFLVQAMSDETGLFTTTLPVGIDVRMEALKDLFEKVEQSVSTKGKSDGEKVFVKVEMIREPGYIFEVTLAPKRENEDIVVPAIKGALIEVYNNTTQEEEMVLTDHPHPDFKVNFKKGNHYTILIRKKGFLAKKMEAYVNVEGCILCFDGVGEVRPGVTDNLSNGLQMGTLLANVEMDPVFEGKVMEFKDITYEFGKSKLTKQAITALTTLGNILYDNPGMTVELGSHTDVRGTMEDNQRLSENRAEAAVKYLTQQMKVRKDRILYKGYGETQIKNKCRSGVDCTDAEHEVNRRTEIKVLEINEDLVPMKSLFSLKKEEEFEAMILSGNVEQIENKPIDEKPVAAEPEVEKVIPTSTGDVEQEEEVKGPTKAELAMMKKKKEKEAEEARMKKEREVYLQRQKEKEAMEKAAGKVSNAAENVESTMGEEQNNGLFSGYKIVIQFSRFPLEKDHKIFKDFSDVFPYETYRKSILYMIGEFETKEEAERYRILNLEESYPSAYVVEMKNGVKMY